MLAGIHMSGAIAAVRWMKGNKGTSEAFSKMIGGGASRADAYKHPSQHNGGDLKGAQVFFRLATEHNQKQMKKLAKIIQLKSQAEAKGNKEKLLKNIRKTEDKVVIRLAYGTGRVFHQIFDLHSHTRNLSANFLRGGPIPENAYNYRSSMSAECAVLLQKLFHIPLPKRLLQRIYEASNVKPEKFSIWKPSTWWHNLRTTHAFMNLDYKGSLADQAAKTATGKSAFFGAIRQGILDKQQYWQEDILGILTKSQKEKVLAELKTWGPKKKKIKRNWEKIGAKSFKVHVEDLLDAEYRRLNIPVPEKPKLHHTPYNLLINWLCPREHKPNSQKIMKRLAKAKKAYIKKIQKSLGFKLPDPSPLMLKY